ncbi:MAG: hypothetical protein M1426_02345, partial [Patescibacteria group bacterium]|nr:hypothetical protein [Patescibacteria group bacterium]
MRKYVFMSFFLVFAVPVWAQWNPDTLVNTVVRQNPYPTFELAKSVSDGSGGLITAWTMLDASVIKLYAQRIDGNGVRKWDTLGVLIAGTNVSHIDMAADPTTGGAVITWKDARTNLEGIYAQRILGNAAVNWTSNGVMVAPGTNVSSPCIVEDGTGGAWVTWIRPDSIGNNHAWTQHIGSSGTSLLPGGLPISVFPRDSSRIIGLQSLPDGTGGILIGMIYHVANAINDTLMVKRFRNDGTPLWSKSALTSIMSAGQYPFDMQVSNNGKVFVTAFVSPSGGWVALQKLSIATGDSAWANMINTGLTTSPQALRVVPDTIGGAHLISKGSTYLNVQH